MSALYPLKASTDPAVLLFFPKNNAAGLPYEFGSPGWSIALVILSSGRLPGQPASTSP
jgi:hypothetical protein